MEEVPPLGSGQDWPEVYEDGLDEGDVSLIRSMLERSPEERLEYLQSFIDTTVALRNGQSDRQQDR